MIHVSIHHAIVVAQGHPLVPASDKVTVEYVLPKRPFMCWLDYHQAEIIPLPKGYGVAYHDWKRARSLVAPMPFNVLIGFLIWIYEWTQYGAEHWFWKHLPAKVRNGREK